MVSEQSQNERKTNWGALGGTPEPEWLAPKLCEAWTGQVPVKGVYTVEVCENWSSMIDKKHGFS